MECEYRTDVSRRAACRLTTLITADPWRRYVFREGVGVLASQSYNTIRGNEIGQLGYTGISRMGVGYTMPWAGHNNLFQLYPSYWDELCDMGGIYILGQSEGTVIESNVIAHVASYHMYAWGVYLDEGASHVTVTHNLVHHTLSAGLHQHFGNNNTIAHNTFACSGGTDGDLAISIGEAHSSFNFSRNVVLRCPSDWANAADDADDDGRQLTDVAVSYTGAVASSSTLILPAAAAWLLWWKGEGSHPNVSFHSNVYSSIRPEETRELYGAAPPWLHLIKRGRT